MILPQPSQGFFWTQEPWGGALKCTALLEVAPHLFTSAVVSVSRDPSDKALAAVASSLGVTADAIVQAHQVHGCDVLFVRRNGDTHFFARPTEKVSVPISADAIVTDHPWRAVAVRVADCAPILMADRRTGAVAAVHAGWRGTAKQVVRAAIDALCSEFGTRPADLLVAIGPSIRACCYEVGPELGTAFADAGHEAAAIDRWFRKGNGDRWQLDVVRANRDQLEAAGVPPAEIHDSGLCTGHDGALHSYRRNGVTAGRMLALIKMKSEKSGRNKNAL
jgi:YfiH family protein